jgi:hypothetical protein
VTDLLIPNIKIYHEEEGGVALSRMRERKRERSILAQATQSQEVVAGASRSFQSSMVVETGNHER